MGFDVSDINRAVARHGVIWRVVVADLRGSAPREIGASMLVWADGQSGTIGGGTLEFKAARTARNGQTGLSHHPLGPALGQCCGGAVTLLTERFDADSLPHPADIHARPARPGDPMPLSVHRALAAMRGGAQPATARLVDGWMIEPRAEAHRAIWIWGAGHVGRALVHTLAPLPDCELSWIDTHKNRFPESPQGVTCLPAADPARLVAHAPAHAEHLIVTYSHALDLELCHRLLHHGFGFAGLIGSDTKWARFRSRLRDLGHGPDRIARITCPIGDPALGKHPQQIAIGVAAALLQPASHPATLTPRQQEHTA
ncbi:MAG: xanthine dehydrogenase accessory protein XdhC [Marinibacterium sp.]|nr:xanthine dehydrogenase accessory protein XdhC [Marinibacterium sp.]